MHNDIYYFWEYKAKSFIQQKKRRFGKGFEIAQESSDTVALTVSVGDPLKVGYFTLYRIVACGLLSNQVEEWRILANCYIDPLLSNDLGGQRD